jgi:hypothetical protein
VSWPGKEAAKRKSGTARTIIDICLGDLFFVFYMVTPLDAFLSLLIWYIVYQYKNLGSSESILKLRHAPPLATAHHPHHPLFVLQLQPYFDCLYGELLG